MTLENNWNLEVFSIKPFDFSLFHFTVQKISEIVGEDFSKADYDFKEETLVLEFRTDKTEEELSNILEKATDFAEEELRREKTRQRVSDSISFGNNLVEEFITENVLLGISRSGETTRVRKVLEEATSCLIVGSLYEAIEVLRAIPTESFDPVFITKSRIDGMIKKLQDFVENR